MKGWLPGLIYGAFALGALAVAGLGYLVIAPEMWPFVFLFAPLLVPAVVIGVGYLVAVSLLVAYGGGRKPVPEAKPLPSAIKPLAIVGMVVTSFVLMAALWRIYQFNTGQLNPEFGPSRREEWLEEK